MLNTYPPLIWAAEGPVVDTSCAALLLLAREVHRQGYKVALTGEGADEWLAGYSWHKINRVLGCLDFIPGLPLSQLACVRDAPGHAGAAVRSGLHGAGGGAVGGHNGWLDIYGLMSMSKGRFYSPWMRERRRTMCRMRTSASTRSGCGAGIRSTASCVWAAAATWPACCSTPRATAWR